MVLPYLRSAISTVRQRGVVGALKEAYNEGYLWGLLDGNYFHTKVKRLGANLVGEDQHGNKYWENMNLQQGRQRWVEYKNMYDYNASSVPPEWHGWLHYISDYTPEQLEALKPSYHREHKPNLTGKGNTNIHLSKGHPMNPEKREWSKFGGWQPSSTSSTP